MLSIFLITPKPIWPLDQWFSTWGTRTPKIHEQLTGGMPNLKKPTQNKFLWVEFMIWGYAKGSNPDLSVHEYQKVKNPCLASSRGLVVKAEDSWPRGPRFKPHYGDHFSGTIYLDQSLEQKLRKTLTWHCCMCSNPANGRVDFEEWSAYKIQVHGTEWIVS